MTAEKRERVYSLRARAENCLLRHDYGKALTLGRDLIELDPEEIGGYTIGGQAARSLNQHKEAEKLLTKALAIDPDSDRIMYELAILYRLTNKHAKAEEYLRAAIEKDPLKSWYWYELAVLCSSTQDYEGCRRYAVKAQALDPSNANILNLLGMAAHHDPKRERSEAIKLYEEALALDPENPYVHNNLGALYIDAKEYDKAEGFVRRALCINPQKKIFRHNLYRILKHRSSLYRLLRAPFDLCGAWAGYLHKHQWLIILLVIPYFLALFALPLILMLVWIVAVWPLMKFYEFLTISDIKAQAREVGAHVGGPLGIHGWPARIRFGCFVIAMVGFWTALWCAFNEPSLQPYTSGLFACGFFSLLIYGWIAGLKEGRFVARAQKRKKKFQSLEAKS